MMRRAVTTLRNICLLGLGEVGSTLADDLGIASADFDPLDCEMAAPWDGGRPGVLAGLLDLRLPLTFTLEDCAQIARIVCDEVGVVFQMNV